MSEQVDGVVALVRDVLGEDVVGAYLHGSSVLGGLGPRSDVDVLVVSRRPTTRAEKRRLVDGMRTLSIPPGRLADGRPLELTIAVHSDIRPWRFPPRRDFQYGDWWRAEFEAGELEPSGSPDDPDLAILITIAVMGDAPLLGPPPADVFDPVTAADLEQAMLSSIDEFFAKFDTDTANTLLVLRGSGRRSPPARSGGRTPRPSGASPGWPRSTGLRLPERGRSSSARTTTYVARLSVRLDPAPEAMVAEIELARDSGRLSP